MKVRQDAKKKNLKKAEGKLRALNLLQGLSVKHFPDGISEAALSGSSPAESSQTTFQVTSSREIQAISEGPSELQATAGGADGSQEGASISHGDSSSPKTSPKTSPKANPKTFTATASETLEPKALPTEADPPANDALDKSGASERFAAAAVGSKLAPESAVAASCLLLPGLNQELPKETDSPHSTKVG